MEELEIKPFYEKTAQEIDDDLEKFAKNYYNNRKKFLLVTFCVLLFVFRHAIIFKIKYSFPRVTSYTQEKIDPFQEPIQNNILTPTVGQMRSHDGDRNEYGGMDDTSEEDIAYIDKHAQSEVSIVKTIDNKDEVRILPMAEYSISGRIVAVNPLFLMFRSVFDNVALFDIGLVWGDISPEEVLKKYFSFHSEKVYLSGARQLRMSWRSDTPFDFGYIDAHLSHTHVIPASKNIFAALLKLRPMQTVKLDGYLVDIFTSTNHIKGSLTRLDSNDTSRGNGACEIMYVKRVQIGNRIYE